MKLCGGVSTRIREVTARGKLHLHDDEKHIAASMAGTSVIKASRHELGARLRTEEANAEDEERKEVDDAEQ